MKIRKDSFFAILFYVSYLFILIFSFFGHINKIGGYLNILSKCSLIILFLIFILQIKKYTKKELLVSSIILFFSIVNLIISNDYTLIKLAMIIICMKCANLEKIIRYDIYTRVVLFLIMILILKTGLTVDVLSFNDGFYKHSLGFTNPNSCGLHFFIMLIEIIYINWNKKSILLYFFLMLILLFLNNYIGCRTVIVCFGLLIILKLIYDHYPLFYEKKIVKKILTNSYFVFFIIILSMYLLYVFNTDVGNTINEILSNRLYNIKKYYDFYHLSLLGNSINLNTTLDTFYAYCFIGYGIIPSFAIMLCFKKLMNKLYDIKNYSLIIIFFVFCFYGLSERIWFLIDYNIFMIYFSLILFKKNS